MKRIFQLFVFTMMFVLSAPMAFAYTEKSEVQEGADITTVKAFALAAPEYTPLDGAPSYQDLIRIQNTTEGVTKRKIVTYDYISEELFHQMGEDIRQIDRRLSKQIFRKKVENFADSYVVLTVVNGRRKFGTAFYFDVFRSGTNELLYAYMIMADKNDPDDEKNYKMMMDKFYKNFEWAAEKQQKEHEKERREAQRKAEREAEKAKK